MDSHGHHPLHSAISGSALAALVGVGSSDGFFAAPALACPPAHEPSVIETVASQPQAAFVNPVFPAPSADPWVVQHSGIWYAVLAVGRSIQLRASPLLSELPHAEPVEIWHAPADGLLSRNIWAPEMHFLDGRWFLYLTGDDGNNDHHRMWVLEAETPRGPWCNRGMLDTGGWAIDATILEADGSRYCVWSGWPGQTNGRQSLYIAPMRNPWTLAAPRTLLTQPTEPWECRAMPICEGPQVLQRHGRTFIVYSASGSWTEDYCLGLLEHRGGDLLDPRNWRKHGPVFQKTDRVWGVGHCAFVHHPSAGDLIFYHAKTDRTPGWSDRNVRVQPFQWTPDGLPDFGEPVALPRA